MRVWPRPSTAVATVTASMPPTTRRSSRTSCWGRASSMTSRRRKGEARASEELTMRRRPRRSGRGRARRAPRRGARSPVTRPAARGPPRAVTGRAGAAAAAATSCEVIHVTPLVLSFDMLRLPHYVVASQNDRRVMPGNESDLLMQVARTLRRRWSAMYEPMWLPAPGPRASGGRRARRTPVVGHRRRVADQPPVGHRGGGRARGRSWSRASPTRQTAAPLSCP